MRWLSEARERLRGLVFRAREEAEMDEELRFHLEMEAERLAREEGLAEAEARRRARLAFGGMETHRERVREARGLGWVEDAAADLRYAARVLGRSPGFAVVVVATLGLGIGANTAIFSVADGVLLRPLPYHEPERLVVVRGGMTVRGEFLAVREAVGAFERVAVHHAHDALSLTGAGEPVRLESAAVSPELFPLLGVVPALGRGFRAEEGERGRDDVVVLGHALWRQRFGADRAVVGRRVRVGGRSRTVVGVMPEGFAFPRAGVQLWVPVTLPEAAGELWGTGGYDMVARLAPGASLQRARAEVAALAPRMRARVPWQMQPDYWRETAVVPLHEEMVAGVRPMLRVLLSAVGLVLLMACVNVANLLLARAGARRGELAVRTALGAGRRRILRQLLTESLLLAAMGGAVGVLVAAGGLRALRAVLPGGLPRIHEVAVDGRALLFALGISVGTGLLFGLAPALRASRAEVGDDLREGRRAGAGPGRHRLAAALVAVQVGLAVVLVSGAGLMVRSLAHLLRVDPGFRTEGVVTAAVAPPEFRYGDDARVRELYRELLLRLRSLPGAQAVALASGLPFAGDAYGTVFSIEGRPDPAAEGGDWPWADGGLTVSEGYFPALGIPLLRGRAFSAADRADAPAVVIVSQALADRYWPGEDPLGQRIRLPGIGGWRTVVGVVGDVRWDDLAASRGSGLYLPLGQGPAGPARVVVRSTEPVHRVAPALRRAVAALDRDTPVSEVRTMEQLVSASVARPRSVMLLLGLFATAALALGAVGIYGVTSYAVTQRRREFGIRMALGARRGDVLRQVLRQGGLLAAAGIALGLPAAALGTRALSGLLYGVGPTDPLTFALVPLVLAAVALLALYLPARGAAGVDPITAMRHE